MESPKIEFLFLSEENMIEAGVLNMHKCVEIMEETFELVGKGDYLMGGPNENHHGIKIFFPKEKRFPNMPVAGPDRRFMAMVAYLGGRFNVCGEKWYGSNIDNPINKGFPRSILITVLNDAETAQPLAIMSANIVSAMRTGAIPGLGAKYLAKKDSKILGLIACGVIGKTCLMSLADVLDLEEVKVYDAVKSKAEEFSKQMSKELGINVYAVDSMEEAIRHSDVVNVAASGKIAPHIKSEWLKEGVLLSLPADAELEEDFLLNSRVVIDEWKMHEAWGDELKALGLDYKEIGLPSSYLLKFIDQGKMNKDDIINLGKVVIGAARGRISDAENIVLMMGGMPVEDVAWSYHVYQNALEKGIGQKLTLWDKPYLL